MSTSHLEPLLLEAERRVIVQVLRTHPRWTLAQVLGYLSREGPRAAALREICVGELLADAPLELPGLPKDGGPPIDPARLDAATHLRGETFDRCVHRVLEEAGGRAVGSSYLRARVGGPRWKLQASLARLEAAGRITRTGKTCDTRYRLVEAD